jgi:hypothetical protein
MHKPGAAIFGQSALKARALQRRQPSAIRKLIRDTHRNRKSPP